MSDYCEFDFKLYDISGEEMGFCWKFEIQDVNPLNRLNEASGLTGWFKQPLSNGRGRAARRAS